MQTSTGRGMMTMEQSLANLVLRRVITREAALAVSSRAEQLDGLLERAGFEDDTVAGGAAARGSQGRGELTMADDEKPTSIWKKEISFRRKPADERRRRAGGESGSSSIWKKEISLRKKDAEHEPMPEPAPELAEPVESEPDLDAAIAALSLPAEPPAVEPEPVAPPDPASSTAG